MSVIHIGSDHAGFQLKSLLAGELAKLGYKVEDHGANSTESCDYPLIARDLCKAVAADGNLGILICGTGIGMSIAANKVKGIRCALCGDTFSARATREHNDANMLALGERVTGVGLALEIVDVFFSTEFSGEPRHARRIAGITAIEESAK